jgi:hypothetical protein
LEAQSLSHLKTLVRASVAAHHHVHPTRVNLQLTCHLPEKYALRWEQSRQYDRTARDAAAAAAASRRDVIRDLTGDGVSGSDIASLLDLSPGRIYQLLKDTPPSSTR